MVSCKCDNCGTVKNLIFKELIRRVNGQSHIVENYNCPQCFNKNPRRIESRRAASLRAIEKIKDGASERSKNLWLNEEYRAKCQAGLSKLKNNPDFAEKVSKAIKAKFANDIEYKEKIAEARKKYFSTKKNPQTWSGSDFIKLANIVHEGIYSYEKVNYISSKIKVTVTCRQHGEFHVRPSHHIHYKNGCPRCNYEKVSSKGELVIVDYIKSICDYNIERSNRSILGGLEIDIWIPERNLGIEYNGAYFHSCIDTINRNYHSIKSCKAHKASIDLLQFVDIDYSNRVDIAKSMIRNKLGLSYRIFARKCNVEELDNKTARYFFDKNHFHGGINSQVAYGLVKDGIIYSVLSFKMKDGKAEIARFANLLDHSVIGGFSRLMNYFIKNNHRIKEIFTYVDRSYTTQESCYSKFGMEFDGMTKPGYRYFKNNKLYNRLKFQKHKLHKLIEKFDQTMSEKQNMLANGYRILYDAGNLRYRLKL